MLCSFICVRVILLSLDLVSSDSGNRLARKNVTKMVYFVSNGKYKKLIRRWDSEHELFWDDIVHIEASAYAHWTDFLITTVSEI